MIGLSTQTHTYRHASVEKRLTKVIVTPISRLLPLYITSIGYDQAIYFPPPPRPDSPNQILRAVHTVFRHHTTDYESLLGLMAGGGGGGGGAGFSLARRRISRTHGKVMRSCSGGGSVRQEGNFRSSLLVDRSMKYTLQCVVGGARSGVACG